MTEQGAQCALFPHHTTPHKDTNTMKLNKVFPSNYLAASDFPENGQPVRATIRHLTFEKMQDGETKPVLYFQEFQKGLILNVTNGRAIAEAYSDETDNWPNGVVNVYNAPTTYMGKPTRGVRVTIPQGPPQTATPPVAGADPVAQAPAGAPGQAGGDEPPPHTDQDIPF